MTNNKKSKQLPGGITVATTIRGKRITFEFATQSGAKCAFSMPGFERQFLKHPINSTSKKSI